MKFLHDINNASMIVEDTNHKFVSDTEKENWNNKANTDTITTINGKTGAIAKSDITALGIPAQDTKYNNATTSVSGLMSGTDKTKLNSIDSGATQITLGTIQPSSGWWYKEI